MHRVRRCRRHLAAAATAAATAAAATAFAGGVVVFPTTAAVAALSGRRVLPCGVPVLGSSRRCVGLASNSPTAAAELSRAAPDSSWSGWSSPLVTFGERFRGPHEVPSGLRYCRDFVDPQEEADLIHVLDGKNSAWMRQIRRAQQFFGLVYYQTSQSIPELQPTSESSLSSQYGRPLEELPTWLLPRMMEVGIFRGSQRVNQMQANEYLEDSGIGCHVEDPAAGATLGTLSLLEPIQLTLSHAVDGKPMHANLRDREDCLKVLLEPRSLLVLEGQSRYEFTHAIRMSKLVPLRDGSVLRRGASYRRVSLTFRNINEEQRSAKRQDMPEGFAPFEVPHL